MKSIITTYIPATNTKPARIKAKAEGVPAVSLSINCAIQAAATMGIDEDGRAVDIETQHKAAALALCAKYSWRGDLVGGGLPDSTGYAWCFVPEEKAIISNLESLCKVREKIIRVHQGAAYDLRLLVADIDGGAFQRPAELRVELLQLADRIDGLGVYPKDSEKNRK